MLLKISARKSDLARLQAYMVGDALKACHPHLQIQFQFKESLGDKNLTDPLWKIPEKGVFTEDFYGELQRGDTDMVVHSWKDLPTEMKSDTEIAATLPRADQRDLLLVKKAHFTRLKSDGSLRVFSSSPRREYNLTPFLKTHLPFQIKSVNFENVRGNIPTRIRKLLESHDVDGLIVAKAALDRLLTAPQAEFYQVQAQLRGYLAELEWMVLPLSINPNAAAQGALAVEIMSHRKDLKSLLSSIDDPSTFACALKERQVLASFGGGCHQKIGISVVAKPYGEIMWLKGLTTAGHILDTRTLTSSSPFPKFSPQEMMIPEAVASRSSLAPVSLPSTINAVFVAKAEAWPPEWQSPGYIWTAGLKTWEHLAQKGLWVHGSSEGLGEHEDTQIQALAGISLQWLKLSHNEGFTTPESKYPLLATYSLTLDSFKELDGKECFFWTSGSHFLRAVQEWPTIAKKFHACGPGNTYKIIKSFLENQNSFDPQKLKIFLDQDDWRTQCTK